MRTERWNAGVRLHPLTKLTAPPRRCKSPVCGQALIVRSHGRAAPLEEIAQRPPHSRAAFEGVHPSLYGLLASLGLSKGKHSRKHAQEKRHHSDYLDNMNRGRDEHQRETKRSAQYCCVE